MSASTGLTVDLPPDDQLARLASPTQLKVKCQPKVEMGDNCQLAISRDSPPFSPPLTDVEQSKLQVSQPTSRNWWLPQQLDASTTVHRLKAQPRGLTAEIPARASSQLFRGTSCAAGGGLGATEGARAAGRPH